MEDQFPPLAPMETGIRGRCPRCGQGHMFNGFLTLKPRCEICDLDYGFADPADGPAFFVMCFACVPSMLLGVWFEIVYEPAWWAHLLVTIPFMALTCILPLRPLKGWLVASQFFYKAEEGRLVKADE
ncbi:DUF983 domain-containing protein [Agrobacterium sp. a22-2]|uniref:DUF983 domain-containing protein n=1 Tax=Agrobacterium sp. a22-2 TaxID=2283840 RepID=UPI001447C7D0|nr:DUF983 domain-containing protein [Agrobacterium sp. a22-2]NKN37453.1 DUF983 domain-containing protein [Agrobacterium sp. a22-2]